MADGLRSGWPRPARGRGHRAYYRDADQSGLDDQRSVLRDRRDARRWNATARDRSTPRVRRKGCAGEDSRERVNHRRDYRARRDVTAAYARAGYWRPVPRLSTSTRTFVRPARMKSNRSAVARDTSMMTPPARTLSAGPRSTI